MGIQDRDYMKRRPSGDDSSSGGGDNKLEGAVGRLLERHPKFFVWLTTGLIALIVVGLTLSKSGTKN
jgi:hypothetical protein